MNLSYEPRWTFVECRISSSLETLVLMTFPRQLSHAGGCCVSKQAEGSLPGHGEGIAIDMRYPWAQWYDVYWVFFFSQGYVVIHGEAQNVLYSDFFSSHWALRPAQATHWTIFVTSCPRLFRQLQQSNSWRTACATVASAEMCRVECSPSMSYYELEGTTGGTFGCTMFYLCVRCGCTSWQISALAFLFRQSVAVDQRGRHWMAYICLHGIGSFGSMFWTKTLIIKNRMKLTMASMETDHKFCDVSTPLGAIGLHGVRLAPDSWPPDPQDRGVPRSCDGRSHVGVPRAAATDWLLHGDQKLRSKNAQGMGDPASNNTCSKNNGNNNMVIV